MSLISWCCDLNLPLRLSMHSRGVGYCCTSHEICCIGLLYYCSLIPLLADGNAESNGFAGPAGTMEAIYIGNDTDWWRERPTPPNSNDNESKRGPFVMADFEDGMFSGWSTKSKSLGCSSL